MDIPLSHLYCIFHDKPPKDLLNSKFSTNSGINAYKCSNTRYKNIHPLLKRNTSDMGENMYFERVKYTQNLHCNSISFKKVWISLKRYLLALGPSQLFGKLSRAELFDKASRAEQSFFQKRRAEPSRAFRFQN